MALKLTSEKFTYIHVALFFGCLKNQGVNISPSVDYEKGELDVLKLHELNLLLSR
jgi:hypothetical protein